MTEQKKKIRKTVTGLTATVLMVGTIAPLTVTAAYAEDNQTDTPSDSQSKGNTATVTINAGETVTFAHKPDGADDTLYASVSKKSVGVPADRQQATVSVEGADSKEFTLESDAATLNDKKNGTATYRSSDDDADQLQELLGVKHLELTVAYTVDPAYTGTVDGKDIEWNSQNGGKHVAKTVTLTRELPATINVENQKGETVTLTRPSGPGDKDFTHKVKSTGFGTVSVHETATYTGNDGDQTIELPAEADCQYGSEITYNGRTFTKNADGTYQLDVDDAQMNMDKTPTINKITLSNGATENIAWGDPEWHWVDGHVEYTRTAKVTGDTSVNTGNGQTIKYKYVINLTATMHEGDWNATVDGNAVKFNTTDGKKYSATAATQGGSLPDSVKASNGHDSLTLTRTGKPTVTGSGQITATYTATGDDDRTFTIQLTTTKYSVNTTIGGGITQLAWTSSGWKLDYAPMQDGEPAKTLNIVDSMGNEGVLTLDTVTGGSLTDGGKLGVIIVDNADAAYTGTFKGKTVKADTHHHYQVGDEIQIENGSTFSKGEDGVYTAQKDPEQQTSSSKLADKYEVNLTDKAKTKVTVKYGEKKQTVADDGTEFAVRTGTSGALTFKTTDPLTGKSLGQTYTVTSTEKAVWNAHILSLTVGYRDPDNPTDMKSLEIPFDENKTEYEVTVPRTAISYAYTLSAKKGDDATVEDPIVRIGPNASRIITVTTNKGVKSPDGKNLEKTYTVTVNFAPADIQADSPAKLTGIYVNKTGKNEQGDLIDDWNENRLDYTVIVGENDPSPYILPTYDKSKVDVNPGKVTQNADSVKQEWIVTDKATKASRTYSVTVVREHSWKTAIEEFTPNAVIAQTSTVKPDNEQDAELVSAGYVGKDGKYMPQDGNKFMIPEGGTFSYEAKVGQSCGVVSQRLYGMTYEYTVTVLPPDMGYPKQHTFSVTYLTEKTHRAELTGINVNNQPIAGFESGKHEYEVAVKNTDQWIVSPQYDKMTGMSVSTDKQGADATITVTSGDGLVQTVYKVHAKANGLLADTGAAIKGVLLAVAALLVAGAALLGFSARKDRKKNEDEDSDDGKPEDSNEGKPENVGEPSEEKAGDSQIEEE